MLHLGIKLAVIHAHVQGTVLLPDKENGGSTVTLTGSDYTLIQEIL